MKLHHNCLPCIFNQIIRVCEYNDLSKPQISEILREVFSITAIHPYESLCPPELAEILYGVITKKTGIYDPYKKLKREHNEMILNRASSFRARIRADQDPLYKAARYALAGNIIDYGGVTTFDEQFDSFEQIRIGINEFDRFRSKLNRVKTLLYLSDNAGEAVFDLFFIEQIRHFFPEIKVYFSVKSRPAINDMTLTDTEGIGIDQHAEVIESGLGIAGTIVSKAAPRFRDLYDRADLVISKGQGNFETLETEVKNILFIFKVKCDVVSEYAGIPLHTNIFAFNDTLKKVRKKK